MMTLFNVIRTMCCLLLVSGIPLSGLHAQAVDSLENEIRNLRVEDQIKRYDDLSWHLMTSDLQQSIAFSKKGLALARRTGDEKMEVTFYHTMGTTFYVGSVFDSAEFYLDK